MNGSGFTHCPILFEDADLLVIDKPEGILSHPNPGNQHASCAFEGSYDPKERCFQTSAGPLWLLHRLDQDTSGILLAAKSKKTALTCLGSFEKREVEKDYLALVSRKPMPPVGKWRDTLVEHRNPSSVRSRVSRSAQPNAFLNYKMKEFFPKFNLSLLEIKLVTGKTHQIRVQAAYHGHPVAGDRIYGNFGLNKELRQELGLRRLFLHAWRLVIQHPVKNEILEITAPLPEELEQCLFRASPRKK